MHISLTWNGAMGRTSYWTGRVYPTDYGPCRVADLNWAFRYTGRNLVPCVEFPQVLPKPHASAVKQALINYSGAAAHRGSTGPVVSALQGGLRVPITGVFDHQTESAVSAFQRRAHLVTTGRMNPPTWRALLAATN